MRDIFNLFLHVVVITIRLARPGGLRSVAAVIMDFAKISPVRALYWTAVINGVLAPFLLIGIFRGRLGYQANEWAAEFGSCRSQAPNTLPAR